MAAPNRARRIRVLAIRQALLWLRLPAYCGRRRGLGRSRQGGATIAHRRRCMTGRCLARPRGAAKAIVGVLMLIDSINEPGDLRTLSYGELDELAGELRDFIVQSVARTSGHLGSNLGAVELTLALHRVFESPTDAVLWDTGHQAYVHKIITGRREGFDQLRQAGGLSGYPSRAESEHDFVENSHASTILSYAYGLAVA